MSDILGIIYGLTFLVIPYVAALVLALGLVATVLVLPRFLLFALVACAIVFPSSPTDALGNSLLLNIYGKGGGYLFFSLYELGLIFLALAIPVLTAWRVGASEVRFRDHSVFDWRSYAFWYFAYGLLFVCYAVIWAVNEPNAWPLAFGRAGVINILFQGLLVAALVFHLRDADRRKLVFRWLSVVAVIVILWGLLRYVFLGGDPQGSYEDQTGGAGLLKITYWDINYSIVGTMLAGVIIWMISTRSNLSNIQKAGLVILLLACLVDVALSARRTAQIGLFLGLIFLIGVLPKGRRLFVILLLALVVPLVAYKVNQRITDNRSVIEKIFKGTERKEFFVDSRYERNYELRLALDEVRKSPIFGVGPAGQFNPPSSIGLGYHKGNYGFIHSGLGHVLFKTGILGLGIFFGVFFTYFHFMRVAWRDAMGFDRELLVASMMGMICGLPNLFVGTPIIEIRSMVIMGVCLAIPAMIAKASGKRKRISLVGVVS